LLFFVLTAFSKTSGLNYESAFANGHVSVLLYCVGCDVLFVVSKRHNQFLQELFLIRPHQRI